MDREVGKEVAVLGLRSSWGLDGSAKGKASKEGMPGLGQAPCFSELFVPFSCNLLQLEWQVAPKGGRKQPRVWTSMPFPFLGPSLPMPGLHQCPAPLDMSALSLVVPLPPGWPRAPA